MMKLKNILLLAGCLLPAGASYAQYAEDALRFSMTDHGVTARFRALGSAQTSLGGDLSSISANPAGLGLFTKNELTFTSDFSNSTINSLYAGSALSANKEKLGFNQLGGVFHLAAPKRRGDDLNTGWLSFNFGVGYNRTNSYTSDVQYGGVNKKSSFADYLSDLSDSYLANGNPASNAGALPSGTLEGMGYRNFLTEYNSGGYFATTAVNNSQQNATSFTGTQSEINLAASGNYNNQLYVGVSLSFNNLNFGADREFTESGKTRAYTGQPADFVGATYTLAYRSTQATQGNGAGGKIGLIYHASPNLRLGFNFVSPTFYRIQDVFSEGLDTRYVKSGGTAIPAYTNPDDVYDSDYDLRSPYKVNAGASLVFAGIGLLTGDVEYVDYSTIHFSSTDGVTTNSINRDIAKNYKAALNERVGAELKMNILSIRGGLNITGNPYKSGDYTSQVISGGLGYRKNNFYTDLTYAHVHSDYTASPYAISSAYPDFKFTGTSETAGITDNRSNFYLTFGVRF